MFRLLYQLPTCLQRLYPSAVFRGDSSQKIAYLTFDDGPIPEVTPQVLDILQKHNVQATFFMVGDNAGKYPKLLAQVRRAGHQIGNHTYNHLNGKHVTLQRYMTNIEQADSILGGTRLFRPPYGKTSHAERIALQKAGYTIYLWDVLTHDYNPNYSSEKMLHAIQHYTRPGSIINFHDSMKSGQRMLRTLDEAIRYLQNAGYKFQTL